MNIKLLRKVKDYILKHPNKYNQNTNSCGKDCGCIGYRTFIMKVGNSYRDAWRHFFQAKDLLNLRDYEADKLLGTSIHWPRKFSIAYSRAKTAKGRARVCARRIEHFIKTNGKE